ncbi:MAG: TraR/DksA family transcriptional regulator [Streptosporangiales bacterium]|nr:TraR/DksA family transcriptional regulator [Streptosporangiales bacterium]
MATSAARGTGSSSDRRRPRTAGEKPRGTKGGSRRGAAERGAGETKTTAKAARPAAEKPAEKKSTEKKKSATRAAPSKFPVREGEDPWTKGEVAEVRKRLEADLANSRAEIDAAESEIASRLDDSVGGAGDDMADAGAKTYQREHDLALTYNARDLLAQTERALERMDSGTYGTCEVCGEPIGKARLQAYPRATLCVQDKQREERR